MKIKKNQIWAVMLLMFVGAIFDLFRLRQVRLLDESEVYSSRELSGLAWLIITSQEQANAVGNKQGVIFPSIDYSKHYLLESQGRKIKSLKYKKTSRFSWEYNLPMGIAEFENEFNPHTIYVYKIEKCEVKQNGD